MNGYKVEISETSGHFTAIERIRMKDTSNATRLDEVVKTDSTLVITPTAYAVLNVHNEKSDSVDYQQIVIIDKGGEKFVTGSQSFRTAFLEIWEEMAQEPEATEYQIEIYKRESKNYKGKQFLTCSIV